MYRYIIFLVIFGFTISNAYAQKEMRINSNGLVVKVNISTNDSNISFAGTLTNTTTKDILIPEYYSLYIIANTLHNGIGLLTESYRGKQLGYKFRLTIIKPNDSFHFLVECKNIGKPEYLNFNIDYIFCDNNITKKKLSGIISSDYYFKHNSFYSFSVPISW